MSDLTYDQHIDCALRLGLISHAYVFLGRKSAGMDHPEATVFEYDPCHPRCTKAIHDDHCEIPKANLVIDDSILSDRLARVSSVFDWESMPYILDIDLDVFSNRASITPTAAIFFHRLIRQADIITIAREEVCVEDMETGCCLEEGLTVEYLEIKLMEHIEAAMSVS